MSIAAGIATVAVATRWGPLHVSTDIVGYPIFTSFNVNNYFTAYYWTLVVFPTLTLLLFLALTWSARRLGLPVPPPRPLRVTFRHAARRDPHNRSAAVAYGWTATVGRVLLVGLSFGLEAAVLIDNTRVGLAVGTLVYSALVLSAAWSWSALDRNGPVATRASRLNALAAPLALLGLWRVSDATQVMLLGKHVATHYPWFPLWLALPCSGALLATVALKLRHASTARVWELERAVVVFLSGAIVLFLLSAGLPGELGPLNFFEEGQGLTGGSLLSHGYFPYRDVVLAHGPFFDAITQIVGWAAFGHTWWGAIAGEGILFVPLTLVATYWLLAYLLGRDWPMLVLLVALLVGSSLGPAFPRFLLWPLVLVALGALLRRARAGRAVAFAGLLFTQFLAAPEALEAVPGCLLVIVLFELYTRNGEPRLRIAFRRTVYTLTAGAAMTLALVIFLASQHALGAFVGYFHALSEGHQLTGGLPFKTYVTTSDAAFGFEALAPVIGLLLWFFYFASRVIRRRPPTVSDWVVTAAALFALPYYQKFLARADNHVGQSYAVALPVLVYGAHRMATSIRAALAKPLARLAAALPAGRRIGAIRVNPVSLFLAVAVGVLTSSQLQHRAHSVPSHFRAVAVHRSTVARAGYGVFDSTYGQLYHDLDVVLNAYLGPRGKVFDFTNEPGLLFYLLGREPASRYYIVGEAFGRDTQREVVSDLRRLRPAVVVYDQACCGLDTWDRISNVVRHYEISQYILAHYKPLANVDGQSIFVDAGRKVPPVQRLMPRLRKRALRGGDPYQPSFPCDWGDSPNYLSTGPTRSERSASVPIAVHRTAFVSMSGWAGAIATKKAVEEVVAVSRGRVVARARPASPRPDVAHRFGAPSSTHFGWQMEVPLSATTDPSGPPAIFGRVGSTAFALSSLVPALGANRAPGVPGPAPPPSLGHAPASAAQTLGYLDQALGPYTYRLTAPPGTRWHQFRWLEVDFVRRPRPETLTISDRESPERERQIAFNTINGGRTRFLIQVGSCPQWYAYRARDLVLTESGALHSITSARLIP